MISLLFFPIVLLFSRNDYMIMKLKITLPVLLALFFQNNLRGVDSFGKVPTMKAIEAIAKVIGDREGHWKILVFFKTWKHMQAPTSNKELYSYFLSSSLILHQIN